VRLACKGGQGLLTNQKNNQTGAKNLGDIVDWEKDSYHVPKGTPSRIMGNAGVHQAIRNLGHLGVGGSGGNSRVILRTSP